ncbi:hypothetical protein LMG29542_07925 [Paraburkholderia humisilvae]|uniref:O-GlcNAc transferase C-terminal domain-containing protein n=2 Tax=Paraburkholderia humisilvae TaxID=627669 RepID=A0A6J5F6P4_9BURK|nr:hypothetical protein LMG29542_07925 [Paraburkholderia humisilvae]
MGVPVVSRVGNTAVGRSGFSLLSNLGLRDLIAFTDEDFVHVASRLCSDLRGLARLRQAMRDSIESSTLMDGASFASHMEAVYREIWSRWCRR